MRIYMIKVWNMEFHTFSSGNLVKPFSDHYFLLYPPSPSSVSTSWPSQILPQSLSLSCLGGTSLWWSATPADLFQFLNLRLIWPLMNNSIPSFIPCPHPHVTLSSKIVCSLFFSSLRTPNRTPQGACQINPESAKEIAHWANRGRGRS